MAGEEAGGMLSHHKAAGPQETCRGHSRGDGNRSSLDTGDLPWGTVFALTTHPFPPGLAEGQREDSLRGSGAPKVNHNNKQHLQNILGTHRAFSLIPKMALAGDV